MNPRNTIIGIFVTLFASAGLADDFKTLNGKEYKNASVTHVEPDGITIKFSGGISKIPCEEITQADQQRFNCCDPQKAVAYAAAQAAAIQQTNQQIEEANKQREKEKHVALELSRRATEQAAKAQNTTIEPGNQTATGRNIVGVGGVNGVEVEMSSKELQLEAAAREEAMSPQEKQRRYERDLKTYEGAKQTAARRGLNSNMIVPPRYGQLDYAPFKNFTR